MKEFILLISEENEEENCRHQYHVLINSQDEDSAIRQVEELHGELLIESSFGYNLESKPFVVQKLNQLSNQDRIDFIKNECEDLRGVSIEQ